MLIKIQYMMETHLHQSARTFEFDLRKPSKTLHKYWFKILLLALTAHVLFQKDISIQFNMNAAGSAYTSNGLPSPNQPVNQSGVANVLPARHRENNTNTKPAKKVWKDRKPNDFSNLTFVLSPDYADRHNVDPAIVREKIQNCRDYVKTYRKIAIHEMKEYGIPASITLAQGLLESNAGDSRLSVESNNHFGIKCRSKCRGCTCRNYHDDDIYDMFRVFESPQESYREHSLLLNGQRYRHLLNLNITDYQNWAKGLKKAGYATDKRYANKLIKIIEELQLHKYDRAA